jgi:hypothetical protein
MRSLVRVFVALCLLVFPPAPFAVGQSSKAEDLTGAWTFALTFNKGKDRLQFTIQQKSNELVGTCESKAFGKHDFQGVISGQDVILKVDVQRHGKPSTLDFKGRITQPHAMSGTATRAGERAPFGRWAATRNK